MKQGFLYIIVFTLFALFALSSCKEEKIPKPRGYFRIDFPEHTYRRFDSGFPYSFEFPEYALVLPHVSTSTKPYWIDVVFPAYRAEINISYYSSADTSLSVFFNDSRKFAYKHTIKADAIQEEVFINEEDSVFGSWYEIEGNAASSVQFYLTDSNRHFFRGALYFNVLPNKDSLFPVVQFIKEDIVHMVQSFTWTDKKK